MSKDYFQVVQHTVPCQYIREYPRATQNAELDKLHIMVNQYIPRDNLQPQLGDVTIIAAHANGVGKELYEPLWDDMYEQITKAGSFKIRSIWMADVAWQGQSGVLNEKKLGNDPSWYDHPRDLLHMINHFRREMPLPLMGIGHSMGGNHIVNLSLMHPRLLHGIILVDPVIQRHVSASANYSVAYLSTFRRDIWPSRAEAEAAMRKNRFYQSWDPRTLDLWIKHGLRELPTAVYPTYTPSTSKPSRGASLGSAAATSAAPVPPTSPTDIPVTLTTTKHQEVFSFARPNYPAPGIPLSDWNPPRKSHPDVPPLASPKAAFYSPAPINTFFQLPFLRPHVLYIFADKSDMSDESFRNDKLGVTGTGVGGSGGVAECAVQHVVVPDAGHFVPFEKPRVVAQHINKWMEPELLRWAAEEEAERREWAVVPVEERTKISKAWEYWMRGDFKNIIDEAAAMAKKKAGSPKL